MHVTTSRERQTASPIKPELHARILAAMGGDTSREAQQQFGVSRNTLCAALAGFPISSGSRALIEEALAKLEPHTREIARTA